MHAATTADPLAASAPSFDRVVAEHLAMISRIAAAHESNLSAREDLVQDIFCAVWRALPKFRGEAGLRSFIARIATNRAVTHVQGALRLPDSSEPPPDLAASPRPGGMRHRRG
jgi:RNA polymerase sigma-70 factor (ECF subfamily)